MLAFLEVFEIFPKIAYSQNGRSLKTQNTNVSLPNGVLFGKLFYKTDLRSLQRCQKVGALLEKVIFPRRNHQRK
jgi:hypothetical protein